MKIKSVINSLLLVGLMSLLFLSCKKEAIKLVPTITISAITDITSNSVKCGGEITSDGGATVLSRGVCWSSTNPTPTISDSKTSDGTGLGFFTSSLTGLNPGTNYFIRAYATNSVGTAYYSQSSFKTLSLVPSISTIESSNTTSVSTTSGGNIIADGGANVIARGVCWSTTQYPTLVNSKTSDGTGSGSFVSSITGLASGTTYFIRSYATNNVGTAYGNQISTTTIAILPIITQSTVSAITSTTAMSNGNITSDGGAAIIARGVCWSTTQNPTTANSKTSDGNGIGSYISYINGLIPNTIYNIRAYATNSSGTAYGNNISVITMPTVIDIDGNIYNTVTIGTQVWMVENLKTTKFNNSLSIPLVTDNFEWGRITLPGYCWYNNDEANKDVYGALYNWYTVNKDNLCPIDWHVPNLSEWTTFLNFSGAENNTGILKEAGTIHWESPNTDAKNSSGFNALPGGCRLSYWKRFDYMNKYGIWWLNTSKDLSESWNFNISYMGFIMVMKGNSTKDGLSVRCIKD